MNTIMGSFGAYESRPQRRYVTVLSALFCVVVFLLCVPTLAHAITRTIPDNPANSYKRGVESWRYFSAGNAGSGASVTRGSRKDTAKVTRTIMYELSGTSRGIQLNIRKRLRLVYEVYKSGAQKGKIYRFYKPSMVTIEKNCRYYRIFRLVTNTKSTLLDYGLTEEGEGIGAYEERTVFTLPRQFPMRRDALTELLRQAFNIDNGGKLYTYRVRAHGAFGAVSVTY